eukprot:jgi/Botrbrau1/16111/Bobra.7_2s0075.1
MEMDDDDPGASTVDWDAAAGRENNPAEEHNPTEEQVGSGTGATASESEDRQQSALLQTGGNCRDVELATDVVTPNFPPHDETDGSNEGSVRSSFSSEAPDDDDEGSDEGSSFSSDESRGGPESTVESADNRQEAVTLNERDRDLIDEQTHGIQEGEQSLIEDQEGGLEGSESPRGPASSNGDDSIYSSGAPSSSPSSNGSGRVHIDEVDDTYSLRNRRTVKFFRDNLDAPVWHGDTLTVKQAAYTELECQQRHNLTNKCVDERCKIESAHRPRGNLYPPSLHICLGISNGRNLQEVVHHVCPNGCHRYDEPVNIQKCPVCGTPRFKSGTQQPAAVVYDLSLGRAIQQLFNDPEWCSLRTTGRDTEDDYYKSSEARRLHEAAGASLDDYNTCVFELGSDGYQPYTSSKHSTAIFTLRCLDIPASHRNKLRFCKIVVIIPGPTQPSSINASIKGILQEAQEYANDGLDVIEHRMVNGEVQTQHIRLRVLLAGMAGDTPANRKVSFWCGHSAELGCGYCSLRGQSINGMRFLGYEEAVPFGPYYPGEDHGTCFAGDPVCKLKHGDHLYRARLMEGVKHGRVKETVIGDNGRERPLEGKDVGCHGMSPLIAALSYLHYNNAFPVPLAHAGPYGVVKRLWNLAWSSDCPEAIRISKRSKKVIEKRAKDIRNTLNFGRQYTCISKNKGNWVMEAWLHWLETWSVYILRPDRGRPLLTPELQAMWDNLRRGLLYHLRICLHVDQDDIATTCQAATTHLKEFARLAEVHCGPVLCTYNLHMLICRLQDQEEARGKAAFGHEYWIEWCVQKCKRILKNRATSFPEITLAKHLLLEQALSSLKASGGVVSFDESIGTAAQPMMASNVDEGDGEGCQLLGSGRALKPEERLEALTGLQHLWNDFHEVLIPAGWSEDLLMQSSLLSYCHADAGGSGEIIHSMKYGRTKTRESYHVRVSYLEPGIDGEVQADYVASVRFFLKVSPSQTAPPEARLDDVQPLRLAIARLIRVRRVPTASGILWRADLKNDVRYKSYPIMFNDMQGKVISAMHRGPKPAADARACAPPPDHVWFVPYSNLSGGL